ncbi:DUF3089 domain-containing protein [soil metagenome]
MTPTFERPASTVRIGLSALCAAVALLCAVPSRAQDAPGIDYSQDSTWLCRPGAEARCTADLDALIVRADGSRVPEPFRLADNAPIDCFYVYPTASREPSNYSDMAASPELIRAVRNQAGRLASRCRLFAPIYRQLTLAGLNQALSGKLADRGDGPYLDVLAAWRSYLERDNQGRGVVLVGHSQGTALLQRLIAEEIDGKPVQSRLVSAFLAGDRSLPVPRAAVKGGVFKQIPLCQSAAQTGCVYAFGSYPASDLGTVHHFGHDPGKGLVPACVNPAAPAGGKGALEAYLPRPAFAPGNDPPWVKLVGQLSAECTQVGADNVLAISLEDTVFSGLLKAMLDRGSSRTGWGLHPLDLNLAMGSMLDLLDAQIRSWSAH